MYLFGRNFPQKQISEATSSSETTICQPELLKCLVPGSLYVRGLESAGPAKKHCCFFRLAGPGLWLLGQAWSHGGCPLEGQR